MIIFVYKTTIWPIRQGVQQVYFFLEYLWFCKAVFFSLGQEITTNKSKQYRTEKMEKIQTNETKHQTTIFTTKSTNAMWIKETEYYAYNRWCYLERWTGARTHTPSHKTRSSIMKNYSMLWFSLFTREITTNTVCNKHWIDHLPIDKKKSLIYRQCQISYL